MKKTLIFGILGGLTVGAAGGFAGGYFYTRKKCTDDFVAQTEEIKQAYQEKYESDLKAEANRVAKEIIFRAQESVNREPEISRDPENGEISDGDSGEDHPEDPPERNDPPVEKQPWVVDPKTVRTNNVFDNPVNPTEPVDYNSMSKGLKFTGQDQLNSNMLRAGREGSESSGGPDKAHRTAKRNQKEAFDNEEAEQDLIDWLGQNRDGLVSGPESDSEATDLERIQQDQEADREILSKVRTDVLEQSPAGIKPGIYVISESDYEVGFPMFTKSFVIYYEGDGVWTDEDYNRLEDPYQIVGCPDDLIFTVNSADIDRVFIRNQNIGTDFECVRYHRSYGDIALDVK